MRRFRLHASKKFHRVSLPALAAACLLLIAAVCFVQHHFSSRAQAKELAVELFTTSREADLDRLTSIGVSAMYDEHFGSRLTEKGEAELSAVGMPYTLLFQQLQSLVERSYVENVELQPIREGAGRGQAVYRYRVTVDLYLDRGIAVLQPVVEQSYSGTLTLKREGLWGWRLDGFTAG